MTTIGNKGSLKATTQTQRDSVDGIKQEGSRMMSTASKKAEDFTNRKKGIVTDHISSISKAIRDASSRLEDEDRSNISEYTDKTADKLDRFAKNLDDRDAKELLDQAKELAKSKPAMFLGGCFALGIVASRYLKSSSQRDHYGKQQDKEMLGNQSLKNQTETRTQSHQATLK